MKNILLIVVTAIVLSSCADPKTLMLNGEYRTFEPYGWEDEAEIKNDSVVYKVNVGNIVWDVIAFETIFVPIMLTAWQLYEPIGVSPEFIHAKPIIIITDSLGTLKYNP